MHGHVFDYGSSCVKLEIDRGFHSKDSGTYLLGCEGVNCCYEGGHHGDVPDVKQWDIAHPTGGKFQPKVTYLGKRKTTELNNKPVLADAWQQWDHLPFTNKSTGVNYT